MNRPRFEVKERKPKFGFICFVRDDVRRTSSVLHSLVLLGITCCALAVPPSAQTTEGKIVGSVADERGGRVPGAEVRVINEESKDIVSALGGDSGQFMVDGLTAGTYTVEIIYSGFPKWEQRGIQISANSVAELSARLIGYQNCAQGWQVHPVPWWARSSGQLLRGTVTRTDQMTPQVTLQVINEKSKAVFTAQANEAGQFAIGEIPDGFYTLKIVPFGHSAFVLKHVRITESSLTTLVANLGDVAGHATPVLRFLSRLRAPPIHIRGTVTDPTTAVIPDAEVRITEQNSTEVVVGLGTCDGSFAVYGLPLGTYSAEVRFSGFKTWVRHGLDVGKRPIDLQAVLEVGTHSGPMVIAAGTPAPPPLPPGQFKGKVVDQMASEVAGATIRLKDHMTGHWLIGQSNMDGRFAFNGVSPGTYRVEVTFPGMKECYVESVGVGSGKSSNIAVILGEDASSIGRVNFGPIEW